MELPLSESNFEEELELLRTQFSNSSDKNKIRIRNLIRSAACYDNITQSGTPIEEAVTAKVVEDEANANVVPAALSMSTIKETSRLFFEFTKYYRDQPQQTNLKKGAVHSAEERSRVNVHVQECDQLHSSKNDFNLKDLQNVWTAFEQYFKNRQTEMTKKKNPFEIDVIIREILQFFSRQDLLKYRLINKSWNSNVVTQYVKDCDIYLVPFIWNMQSFCKNIQIITVPSIFKRAHINLDGNGNSLEDCATFCEMMGPYIKDLRIYGALDARKDKYLQFHPSQLDRNYQLKLRTIFQSFPQLESLSLCDMQHNIISQSLGCTPYELQATILLNVTKLQLCFDEPVSANFIEDIFVLLPNVKELDFDWSMDQNLAPIIAAISKLKLDKVVNSFNVMSAKYFWEKIKDQKLKSLTLTVDAHDQTSSTAFESFFESQRGTLKSLHIYPSNDDNDSEQEIRIKLPLMPVLQFLTLESIFPFSSSAFKSMPNLDKLCLMSFLPAPEFPAGGVYPSVKYLEFSGSVEEFDYSLERMSWVRSAFPNVRKLTCSGVPLGDEGLAIVFSFPKLEFLELDVHAWTYEKNLNTILSGIPVESSWLARQLIAMKPPLISSLEVPGHSLRSMKALNELKINFISQPGDQPGDAFLVDEVGLHFGFLAIPRLRKLTLRGHFMVPDNAVTELSKHHTNVIISPTP